MAGSFQWTPPTNRVPGADGTPGPFMSLNASQVSKPERAATRALVPNGLASANTLRSYPN